MNYQLRLLYVPVVPLHAETAIVRIDSAHAKHFCIFVQLKFVWEKLEMGVTSLIRNRQPLPLNRAHQKLSFGV